MSEHKAATETPAEPAQTARIAAPQPPATAPARLLALQRTAGNRAVAHAVALARTPTHVSGTFTERRTGTLSNIQGTTSFDIDFTPLTAELTVKIKLTPDAGIPTTDVDRVKADAEANFARLWDSKFLLTDDRTEEPFLLHARVVFVTTGEHLRVRLKPGDGAIDQTTWHVQDLGIEYAHEISHTLGLKDEYVDAQVVNRRTSASPGVFEDHSIMGNYFNEGIPQAEVKLRHGEALAAVIGRATHRRYRVAFTGRAQGERLVRWRGIRDAELPGSGARTAAASEVESIERDLLYPEMATAAGQTYTPTP